jgi:hypothetical protein
MTDSVRERLLAAITAAALGEYGEYIAVDDELPVTVVADGDDQATTDQYGITTNSMPVTLARAEKAISTSKAARRTQAHAAVTLLVQRMFADSTFGGLAHGLTYTGCGIQTEGAGAVITAQAFFTVTYQHLAGNPLALPGVFD